MNYLLYYIFPFIAVLGILIFFHEFGHFLMAKYFGVKVLKFALGFGPRLLWKKIGETEYSIRYFPLGGFVKMLGEDIEDEESKDLSPEEAARAFNNQHTLKRMAIVAAGPIFNLGLALIIFCGIYLISGIYIRLPEIGKVLENSPASKAGLLKGDVIQSIQGKEIENWFEILGLVQDKAGIPLNITVKRGDKFLAFTVIPKEEKTKNIFGEDVKSARIGISDAAQFKKIELMPWDAVKEGVYKTWEVIELTFVVIGKLFQGKLPFKSLGGPVKIAQMTGQVAQENVGALFPFMAVISIGLGIFNLFPIPILDGGLIAFLFIELLTGKPLSLKKTEFAQKVGLALLVFLMLIVTYNDLAGIENVKKFFEKLFG